MRWLFEKNGVRGGRQKKFFSHFKNDFNEKSDKEKNTPLTHSFRVYIRRCRYDKDFWTIFPLSLFPFFLKSRHFLKRKLTKGRNKIWEELEGR